MCVCVCGWVGGIGGRGGVHVYCNFGENDKKIGDYYALIVVDWNYRTLIVVRRGKHWRVPEQSYHSLGQ